MAYCDITEGQAKHKSRQYSMDDGSESKHKLTNSDASNNSTGNSLINESSSNFDKKHERIGFTSPV